MVRLIKKMTNINPLNILENELNKVIRNKTLIKATSMQVNFILWLQNRSDWQREWILKSLQIPTEQGLTSLYSTINRLENENFDLKNHLKNLEKKLDGLEKEQTAPKRKPRAAKKKPTNQLYM
tara:strand:- start:329 stop:697 length:369 start_codon:yes stop_codon:yes gene_type:complete